MIVNFYKKKNLGIRSYKLVASKNVEYIPQKGTLITLFGQLSIVERVYFDMDKWEYNLYIRKA